MKKVKDRLGPGAFHHHIVIFIIQKNNTYNGKL